MKKNLAALVIIACVMFACPWAAVTFAPGDAGMAIMFVLFFGVNFICSLYVGIYSGLAVKRRWYLPVVNAAAFLLGCWLLFGWGNPDFTGYAVAYLVVGLFSMVVTVFVVRGIRRQLGEENN